MDFQFSYLYCKNLYRTISSKDRLESTLDRLTDLVKGKDFFVLGSNERDNMEWMF